MRSRVGTRKWKRGTTSQHPPKRKSPLTVASQGMKRGDNHKPPEEKQMSIFANWP
jgi:hypothetical protein